MMAIRLAYNTTLPLFQMGPREVVNTRRADTIR